MSERKPTSKAIMTTYRGPTNTIGSRIIARAHGVRPVIVSYNYETSIDGNHEAAAKALLDKYQWGGTFVAGGMPDGDSVMFVCSDFGARFTVGGE